MSRGSWSFAHTRAVTLNVWSAWRGIRLGLPPSIVDLETATLGMGGAIWLGYQTRPVLAPLTLQSAPLSPAIRTMVVLGAVNAVHLALSALW